MAIPRVTTQETGVEAYSWSSCFILERGSCAYSVRRHIQDHLPSKWWESQDQNGCFFSPPPHGASQKVCPQKT